MKYLIISVLSLFIFSTDVFAKEYANWGEIADDMEVVLDSSYQSYFDNDADKAKEEVNSAYFDYYEVFGFERSVLSYISGKRAAQVEYQFAAIKTAMSEGKANKEVRLALDDLIKWLHEDADRLDGRQASTWSIFLAAFAIIVREGVEAILVIAAIIAYLVRSGNQRQAGTVYISSGVAILASFAMAYALQTVFSISGASQEILEGAAMLLAVLVLYFVSNWMAAKSEADAWKGYIDSKVESAVNRSSVFALALAAFLSVFREGAETVLFYQALITDAAGYGNMIWLGFGVGCVILVFVFAIIRFGSLRLPLKPFFIGTSVLMYIMCVAFAGGGIKELQEADVISVTPVAHVQSITFLGIYPTVETLFPQLVLIVLAMVSFIYYRRKSKQMSVIA